MVSLISLRRHYRKYKTIKNICCCIKRAALKDSDKAEEKEFLLSIPSEEFVLIISEILIFSDNKRLNLT